MIPKVCFFFTVAMPIHKASIVKRSWTWFCLVKNILPIKYQWSVTCTSVLSTLNHHSTDFGHATHSSSKLQTFGPKFWLLRCNHHLCNILPKHYNGSTAPIQPQHTTPWTLQHWCQFGRGVKVRHDLIKSKTWFWQDEVGRYSWSFPWLEKIIKEGINDS